ncbi:hypothetical protein HT102_01570 [Hoyosella sp. G463]|uniref:Uncharacterized protein n=1 Tax=Lolliginicoccus lacisalsi TaxID=2742202 RepID=A0A927J9N5_9ACTN|nr:hypothetical protein [Lolliginicoccus lacisalsi]MBD8505179.1 hypothetical protein [Lolliginicoccus lacisalsi]
MTEGTSGRTDTPRMIGLRSGPALAIAAAWTIAECARAWTTGTWERGPAWWLASVLLIGAATLLLLRAPGDPLPARATAAIAVLPGLAALANVAMIGAPDRVALYASWTWPTGTIILSFLVLRGRTLAAWAGEALLSATILGWWFAAGPVPSDIADPWQELSWNLSMIGTCTILGITLRRQVSVINELRDTAASVEADRSGAAARVAERDRQLVFLNATARPLLEAIVRADEISASDLARISSVEAQLRDRIRARSLATEEVLAAARDARARGATVILLDDGGLDHLAQEERASAVHAISEALRGALVHAGPGTTVTARVLPPGRGAIATVLSMADNGVTRFEITPESLPRAR